PAGQLGRQGRLQYADRPFEPRQASRGALQGSHICYVDDGRDIIVRALRFSSSYRRLLMAQAPLALVFPDRAVPHPHTSEPLLAAEPWLPCSASTERRSVAVFERCDPEDTPVRTGLDGLGPAPNLDDHGFAVVGAKGAPVKVHLAGGVIPAHHRCRTAWRVLDEARGNAPAEPDVKHARGRQRCVGA